MNIIITPSPHSVEIAGGRIERPASIPPSQWLDFWENARYRAEFAEGYGAVTNRSEVPHARP